jgi:hypothetical protein
MAIKTIPSPEIGHAIVGDGYPKLISLYFSLSAIPIQS